MRRYAFVLTAVVGLVAGAACGGREEAASPTTVTPTITATPATVVDEQPEVIVETGIPFATFGDMTLTLDLYLPADPSDAPVAVESWYPDELAQAGAIVATIDQFVPDTDEDDYAVRYLSDHGAHIRAKAEAEACAISFVRAQAAELGNDDPVVVLTGFSEAGGIAAHVALFGESLEQRWDEYAAEVGGPPRQVDCTVADGSTHVDALVGGAGTYDLYVPVIEGLYGRTWMKEHNPELQQFLATAVGINPELTVRLAHATDDPAIPMTVSTDFEAALTAAGYDVQLTTFEGGHDAPPADIGLEIYADLIGL
jgi:dienelactone hydrolase